MVIFEDFFLRRLALKHLFFAKVAFSGFLLGNRQKIAVVANADFSRQGGKMASCLT
jgi:hypothetical protein